MNSKKWIKYLVVFYVLGVGIVSGINYCVDPYNLYKTNIFKEKPEQVAKIKLVKVFKTKIIKPMSIVLGTSRAEFGYDPTHEYFSKPSYNLATSSSSMYENLLNFKYALKQGNLKKVLLVVDYRMFNEPEQKGSNDFETYFDDKNIYSLLFSNDVLIDSFKTVLNQQNRNQYLENGQRDHNWYWKNILELGGHLEIMKKDESKYYKDYPTNYTYKDTKKKSFPDFEEIVKLCYENNIELDIIFGPSHIRQWEAFDYYLGYEKLLEWKKNVVISVNELSQQYNKIQFRIMDFSVYHPFTAEKVPIDKNTKMQYYWESGHYKHELGVIVLDRLVGDSKHGDFGVELNLTNIDEHLKQQKINRARFIDIEKYKEDFSKYLKN